MDEKNNDQKPQPPSPEITRQRSEKRKHFNKPERPIDLNPGNDQGNNQGNNNQAVVEQDDLPPVIHENPTQVDQGFDLVGEDRKSSDEEAMDLLQLMLGELTTAFDLTPVTVNIDERNLRIDQNKPTESDDNSDQKTSPRMRSRYRVGEDVRPIGLKTGGDRKSPPKKQYVPIVDLEFAPPQKKSTSVTNKQLANLSQKWTKPPSKRLIALGTLMSEWDQCVPPIIHNMQGKEADVFVEKSINMLREIKKTQKELTLGGISIVEDTLLDETGTLLQRAILKGCEQQPENLKGFVSLEPEDRSQLCDRMLEELPSGTELTKVQMTILGLGIVGGSENTRAEHLRSLRVFRNDDQVAKTLHTGLEMLSSGGKNAKFGEDLATNTMEIPELQMKIFKSVVRHQAKDMQPGTGYNRTTGTPIAKFTNSCGNLDKETRQVLLGPIQRQLIKFKSKCQDLESKLKDPNAQTLANDIAKEMLPGFLEEFAQIKFPEKLAQQISEINNAVKEKVAEDKEKGTIKWSGTKEVQGQMAIGSFLSLGIISPLITSGVTTNSVPELTHKSLDSQSEPLVENPEGKLGGAMELVLRKLSSLVQELGTEENNDEKTLASKSNDKKQNIEAVANYRIRFAEILSSFAGQSSEMPSQKGSDSDSRQKEPINEQQVPEQVINEPSNGDTEGILNKSLGDTLQFIPKEIISDEAKEILLNDTHEDHFTVLRKVWDRVLENLPGNENAEMGNEQYAFIRLGQILKPMIRQLDKLSEGENESRSDQPKVEEKKSTGKPESSTPSVEDGLDIINKIKSPDDLKKHLLKNTALIDALELSTNALETLCRWWNIAINKLENTDTTPEVLIKEAPQYTNGVSKLPSVVEAIFTIVREDLDKR